MDQRDAPGHGDYAALLVKDGYRPQNGLDSLPETGSGILAVAVVPGAAQAPSPVIDFSGYQWRLRDAPSSRGGRNVYSPSNIWVDRENAMHLRIARMDKDWSCAETSMMQDLGYGTYEFVVRGLDTLEPAAVFEMFTYDYASGALHNREMNIEISRWGDPANKNGQYVLQPYYVAANVHRFNVPDPILRDEVFRIACEGLRNAIKHARARRVEAEISYGGRVFRLRIRDDGNGIPAEILESGRDDHYGLRGTRERARQSGASLEIWSRSGMGTEIDLRVPGSIAYSNLQRRIVWPLFRSKAG